ncbi:MULTISPECIES: DUF1090 domain-containing protein [Vreelandella]|uniref:DUF1090 domain-containing protein n=2 Tax=Vreelandella TaxID=3137766 RepID=A0A7C9P7T2_9GAMM|nr:MULTISPECIES: DUF1090 domain-containing protein [Halomonas]NDL69035.1 DUF1090 domain-containing protein [Halomonas alkaliphila]NYS44259.1 DUF1090 domain-containing protein [Halomonas zhaodongensis]
MKRTWLGHLSVAAAAGILLLPVAHAAERLCEDKISAVRQQLEQAQAHGNHHRVRGLQRSLQSIEENCTNEKVLAEAAEEVRESQEEVRERELVLEEALREGDEDNIQKRRKKLAEEVRELEEHTQELNLLQQRINE